MKSKSCHHNTNNSDRVFFSFSLLKMCSSIVIADLTLQLCNYALCFFLNICRVTVCAERLQRLPISQQDGPETHTVLVGKMHPWLYEFIRGVHWAKKKNAWGYSYNPNIRFLCLMLMWPENLVLLVAVLNGWGSYLGEAGQIWFDFMGKTADGLAPNCYITQNTKACLLW